MFAQYAIPNRGSGHHQMTSECPSFAVVIPALNEEAGIRACVEAVDSALAALPNTTGIVVVDDGSVDTTAAKVTGATASSVVILERHPRNLGYGAAVRTGTRIAAARGFDYVVFIDSDLTNNPRYLAAFAEQMGQGVDVIKASRYIRGGGVAGVPAWRVALSVAGNVVARLLLRIPIRDCTNGFRAVRTTLLTSVELRENGFAVIMEELYRLRPLARTYAEVPIVLTTRPPNLGVSRFSFGPRAMVRYLKYPLKSLLARPGPRFR